MVSQEPTIEQLLSSQQQYQRKDGDKNGETTSILMDQNNKLEAENDHRIITNTPEDIINSLHNSHICAEQEVTTLPDVVRQEKENITTSQVKCLRSSEILTKGYYYINI